jgi:hypothetical protein
MLPRERVHAMLGFATPDKIAIQIYPSPVGLYQYVQKLFDLTRKCEYNFGDLSIIMLSFRNILMVFSKDWPYHSIRVSEWGTTWHLH